MGGVYLWGKGEGGRGVVYEGEGGWRMVKIGVDGRWILDLREGRSWSRHVGGNTLVARCSSAEIAILGLAPSY